jgi:hypothetical protein
MNFNVYLPKSYEFLFQKDQQKKGPFRAVIKWLGALNGMYEGLLIQSSVETIFLQCQGTHRKCFQDTFPDFSAKNILEGS